MIELLCTITIDGEEKEAVIRFDETALYGDNTLDDCTPDINELQGFINSIVAILHHAKIAKASVREAEQGV